MGQTDFGAKFPTKGRSSHGTTKVNATPGAPKNAMPSSGKPKSKVDEGAKFPVTRSKSSDGQKGTSTMKK